VCIGYYRHKAIENKKKQAFVGFVVVAAYYFCWPAGDLLNVSCSQFAIFAIFARNQE